MKALLLCLAAVIILCLCGEWFVDAIQWVVIGLLTLVVSRR